VRVAYADPPYPGQAHLYADHADYAGEVDHPTLLRRLEDFDAWALHTSSPALAAVLPLCPSETRVLAWVKGWCSWKPGISPVYAWEPVLLFGQRRAPEEWKVRDWFMAHARTGDSFVGAKPEAVIRWVFSALALEPTDELDDLFPGTGAVAHAWARWSREPRLSLSPPPSQQETADV
jgi:hypothetical protein